MGLENSNKISIKSSEFEYLIIKPYNIRPDLLNKLSYIFPIINDQNICTKNKLENLFETTDPDDPNEKYLINCLNDCRNELEAFTILAQMWKHSKFCDLIIVVKNREYLAHRVAVSYHSEKYR